MNAEQEHLCAAQGVHLCCLHEGRAMPRAYASVALASFVLVAGATMPTPLYQIYREIFHFSDFTLTVIFGIYAMGVIPALLLFGPMGDALCRRRVLMAAICSEIAGIVLLSAAEGVGWLLLGRLLVGIGVGASQGNLSAALVEMQPRGDRRRAGVMTTTSAISGAAAGPLISGLMAEYLPDPLFLCYVVQMTLLTAALLAVATISEDAGPVSFSAIRIHRPGVPRGLGMRFASAGIAGGLAWSIGGVFAALVPSYASGILHVRNLAAGGILVALMLGSSVVCQLIMKDQPPFRLQVMGLGGAIVGLGVMVAAWPLSSLPLMIAGSIVCGATTGIAYLGSISELNQIALPERRGSMNSLYFVIIYLFFALPAVGIGFAATRFGLFPAVRTFALLLSVMAGAEILWLVIRRRSSPEI